MKTVLVTGASGFIGQHCLPLLTNDDFEVHAVSSKTVVKSESNVFWHQADLLNEKQTFELLAKVEPTHLLHLAWFVEPGKYWSAPENIRWVQASLSLLQAFLLNHGRRVVMAGTCAEYDWSYGYCTEQQTPLRPKTLYGVCKHSLQTMLAEFANSTGLSAAWGRVFFPFGPHEHPARLIPSVINSILKNEPAHCSHGDQLRDFIYVEDVAKAFTMLLGSEATGPFNIASGEAVALKEVVYRIAAKLQGENLIRMGTIPVAQDEPRLLAGDVGRSLDLLGWKPHYDLDMGLEQTVSWWKSELRGALN